MAFISAAPVVAIGFLQWPVRRSRRRPRHSKMALSGPDWSRQRPQDLSKNSAWPPDVPTATPQSSEYHGWSSDFLELCDAQLQLLASTVPNIAQVLLFFRKENPATGALEFVPLVVHSRGDDERNRRVWITAPGAAGQTELEAVETSHVLPGGIPAKWILPDYPFKTVGEQGGIVMPDGGLCIPVEYNGVLAGSLVLCPEVFSSDQHVEWAPEDIKRADMVAKSIALGAALEGKWQASADMLGTGKSLIDSMRMLLATTLHQVRSPVAALVTFGHLLLRKLPPGDSNRALAKNIILEALRVDELLQPLNEAGDAHVLPEAVDSSSYDKGVDNTSGSNSALVAQLNDGIKAGLDHLTNSTPKGMQLLWLSDILAPQAEIAKVLAAEKGMTLVVDIDDDTPPVMAVEKYVREALSNLLDNALKYSPPGSYIGLSCATEEVQDEKQESSDEIVIITVWDTGYGFSSDEQEAVWEFGRRGSAAERSGSPGSGIGLSAVREMLRACGAEISLESPLPLHLDPRPSSESNLDTPGSAFVLRFKRPPR